MRLLFSCRQPSQRKPQQKRRHLLFLQLAVQPKLHSTHHLLCHANHPPNSGATISIPSTVQFPNCQICFLFLSNGLFFSTTIKCPKPIPKRQSQLAFPHRFAKWWSKLLPFAQKPFCACFFAKQSMRFFARQNNFLRCN